MKGKEIIGLMGIIALLALPIAIAYDASTPYTVTMIWSVPSDTTFSVTVCATATDIVFNASSKTEVAIEPDCQVAGTSTAMLTIQNDGNTNINLTSLLTASKPAFATSLNVSTKNDFSDAQEFNTSYIVMNSSLASGESIALYFQSSILNADAGDTSRTYQVASNITATS